MSLIQPVESKGSTKVMSKNNDSSTKICTNSNKGKNSSKGAAVDGGIQMFKISSRSQLKHRAQKNVKKGSEKNDSEFGEKSSNS